MNKLSICVWAVLPILAFSSSGAQLAQARLYCLSPRFQHGGSEGALYSLDLTTLTVGINGELMPTGGGSYTHFGYLEVTDELFGENMSGHMYLNVPSGGDANGNGWPDFFEVAQPVSTTSSGTFSLYGFASGTVQATWSREASASAGTCILKFKPNGLYVWETFTHPFELLEYTGPLNYTPGVSNVTGTVSLQRTGNDANTLDGSAFCVKVATNRFNQLDLQPGGWTNENQQVLLFPVNFLDRDPSYPTNYYGYFDFTDGEPNTAEADYYTWVISIDDLHDADQDGIPDFSDDPATTPPRQPWLALSRGETNLWLTISGDTNRVHRIQETTNVLSANWQTIISLTQTNDPQVISLRLPASGVRFWRVLAE